MVGWIEKIYEKRWMVGWLKINEKNMDVWMDKKYMKKDGWLDGKRKEKKDGWLDGWIKKNMK